MKLVLSIKADTNDADYVTQQTVVTPEQLAELQPVFEAIAKFKPYKTKTEDGQMDWTHNHNWPMGDGNYMPRTDLGEKEPKEIYAKKLTPEQVEMFSDLCPFGEYGIHTIAEIKVMEVGEETVYYKHKYS